MDLLQFIQTSWQIFLSDIIRYAWGTGLIVALLWLFARPLSRRKIQTRDPKPGQRWREIRYSILSASVFGVVGTAGFIVLGGERLSWDWQVHPLWWHVASVILLAVMHDTYFYWTHRLMHWKPLFKYTHKVHHLSRTPTPFAAYAFAAPEAAVQAIFFVLWLHFVPMSGQLALAYLAFLMVRNAIGHSGHEFYSKHWLTSPLSWVTTVTHHDLHHDRFHHNYALHFTWWDRWMGTEHPDYREEFYKATRPSDASEALAG